MTEGTSSILDLAIDGESISAVGPPGSLGSAKEAIDASGLLVLPGMVDAHFHCRAPSHPERGTFGSESRAAAAGGVTTILEMPVSDPACSTPEVLLARRSLGEAECFVDFGLFSGAALGTVERAEAMADAGAIGFKMFTHNPPVGREREFDGLWASSDGDIYEALSLVAPTGLTCTVHAENQSLIDLFDRRSTGEESAQRPPVIESASIALLGALSVATGAKVHIAHMSSAASVEALAAAQANGHLISGETTPHYLVFNDADIEEFGSFVRVAPPLRTKADNEQLWEAVASGLIGVVASDHAPFTPAEKAVPYDAAPRGIPGIELMLPVMLDAAARGVLPVETAVRSMAEAPARLFGLFPEKGALAVGSDADVVLWDPKATSLIEVNSLVSRCAKSAIAYDGKSYAGKIAATILRGRAVFKDGSIVGESRGRFVRPIRQAD
ncbi:MAG: dihydroorotase family protein [Acidimicrobiia bacterium]|nr:dihydroorotase family protein [Acidimicrobiia bacterium]MDH3462949.1 dihydroorotase family protein [Acidimicrobiia bacterium]